MESERASQNIACILGFTPSVCSLDASFPSTQQPHRTYAVPHQFVCMVLHS